MIQLVENDKNHLKPFPKSEKRIKSLKHYYGIAQRVYASTYANVARQFKIYLNSLPPDELDEIENDFLANGNKLLSVQDTFPCTDGYLFVPDGETPPGIIAKKLNLKELFFPIFRTKSNGLVSSPFLALFLLFFAGKETLAKNFLTELYKNLTVDVLSSDNVSTLEFNALSGLCA